MPMPFFIFTKIYLLLAPNPEIRHVIGSISSIRSIFSAFDQLSDGANPDQWKLTSDVLQLFNILFPFSNYTFAYQTSQYSSNYESGFGDYPYVP